jgi:hypothetical protein
MLVGLSGRAARIELQAGAPPRTTQDKTLALVDLNWIRVSGTGHEVRRRLPTFRERSRPTPTPRISGT